MGCRVPSLKRGSVGGIDPLLTLLICRSAGTQAGGLEVWRVDDAPSPSPLGGADQGSFGVESCFLVLATSQGGKEWCLHVWVGKECKDDVAEAAA